MRVEIPRGVGLDLHKKMIAAVLQTPEGEEKRLFGTTTRQLEALAEWMQAHQVTHVAMEGTGVYWKPAYNVLEEYPFELLVVNSKHYANPKGEKTDFRDATHLCELLRHGLLQPSFIPSREQRERRELAAYRRSMVRERASEINRVQKVLEGANIKLASVATDVMGASGRLMLTAMVQGVTDSQKLADMACGKLREKLPALEEALYGKIGEHQRMLLKQMLSHIDHLDSQIATLNAELDRRLQAWETQVKQLDGIYGIGWESAETILAVIGTDMSRFPSADHLASWAGLSPANNKSAGKQLKGKGKQNKGNRLLRETLIECAHAIAHGGRSYLSAQYRRVAARRGSAVAAVAVAHSLIVIIYHMLKSGEEYHDLGPNYFDRRDRQKVAWRLAKRLEALGFKVSLCDTDLDAALSDPVPANAEQGPELAPATESPRAFSE